MRDASGRGRSEGLVSLGYAEDLVLTFPEAMGEASSIRAVREREVVVDWGIDGVDGRSLVLIVFVNLDEAVLVEGQWADIVVGRQSMGYW